MSYIIIIIRKGSNRKVEKTEFKIICSLNNDFCNKIPTRTFEYKISQEIDNGIKYTRKKNIVEGNVHNYENIKIIKEINRKFW